MTRKKYPILYILILLLLACVQQSHGQSKDSNILNRHIKDLTIRDQNINLALSRIAGDYHIPIGLEMVPGEGGAVEKNIKLDIKDSTCREILDAIVEQDDRYEWKLTDGVVNVYPKANRDAILQDVLATKVKRFSLDKNTSLYRARVNIVEVPEIKSKLKDHQITPFIVAFTGIDYQKLGNDFSMNVSDVTLQEILNQIIKQSATKYWIVNRYGENHEFLILNF